MNEKRTYSSPLRQQQTEDTRRRILEVAIHLISENPHGNVTHEEVATRSSIALRTIYRHFPSRADLLDAVWQESDHKLGLIEYPETEEALLAAVETVYEKMDQNAPLIRALLNSDAGREMRRRDNERRRQGVAKALENATRHLSPKEKARVVGVFQVLFGGRTWEMLRDRAHLDEGDASRAVSWAMHSLLDSLYREQKRLRAAHKSSTSNDAEVKGKAN